MRSRVISEACSFRSVLLLCCRWLEEVGLICRVRELKTADEEKALLEKSKIDTICPEVFLL